MRIKKVSRIGVFLLILLVSSGITGCDFTWYRYYNKQYRFSLLLPRGWQREEGTNDTVILVRAPLKGPNDMIQENINVVVKELPAKLPLSTLFELNREEVMERLGSVADIDEGGIFAGLLPGKWLAFNAKMQDVTLRIISAMWTKGNYVYVVTCVGQSGEFPKYEPLFQKAMRSLRIK